MNDETRRLIKALMACIRDNGEFRGRSELLVWGSGVLSDCPDTITLPRADVEALMDLLRRAKHCIGDNYLHWQGEADVALATLRERMK